MIAVAIFFSASLATRVALVWTQSIERNLAAADLLGAFSAGALADLEAALWLCAPLVLFLSLLSDRRLHSRSVRTLLALGLSLTLGLALFVGVAEFFFF